MCRGDIGDDSVRDRVRCCLGSGDDIPLVTTTGGGVEGRDCRSSSTLRPFSAMSACRPDVGVATTGVVAAAAPSAVLYPFWQVGLEWAIRVLEQAEADLVSGGVSAAQVHPGGMRGVVSEFLQELELHELALEKHAR